MCVYVYIHTHFHNIYNSNKCSFLLSVRNKIHRFYANLTKKYGSIYLFKIPGVPPIAAVTEPDDCEKMIRATMNSTDRPALLSLKAVRKEAIDDYFENKSGVLLE